MIVAIHQPNYIPWCGYFYKIIKADCFVLFDNAQYPKGTLANRNRIKTSTGTMSLTVPVRISKGHLQKMNQIEIVMEEKWQHKHWKSIKTFYNRTTFFKLYESEFESIYKRKKWASLAELNETLIFLIRDLLGIKTLFVRASEVITHGVASNLTICKALGASCYLSGDGSQGYLVEEEFIDKGIIVNYVNFKHPDKYPQLYSGFIPNLSVIDLLFNCGPESLRIIKSKNEAD